MERSLNQKYANLNFLPERMVVSSLLFAKNAPFMIRDAVKYLISKDASALVIKNVFCLPIHESILRYADSKNFPIFLMDDTHMFFEDFIMQVGRCRDRGKYGNGLAGDQRAFVSKFKHW